MIEIRKGDITKIDCAEAIVNAAKNTLLGGAGVDGAIHWAAGPRLLLECMTLGGCRTGQAKMTKAYHLPCKNVIHTVGPVWKGGRRGEDRLLAECYRNSFGLAVENHIRSIAFPSISTGIYGFPVERAAKIAVSTAVEFLKENPESLDLVMWVLFDDVTYSVYQSIVSGL